MHRFTFAPTVEEEHLLYLTQEAFAALGRRPLGRVAVSYGARQTEAQVVPIYADGTELAVSAGVARTLGLVTAVPYRLRWVDGTVRIGPVIGILAARSSGQIDLSPGSTARNFLLRYPAVGGLVYLFGAEDVDLEAGQIRGHYWVPDPAEPAVGATGEEWERARRLAARVVRDAAAEAREETLHPRVDRFLSMAAEFLADTPLPAGSNGVWSGTACLGNGRFEEGVFPLPGAIWRRAGFLGQQAMERLVASMGPRIFNSHFFDKQEGFRLLAADPAIQPHLPATEPLDGFGPLFERLAQESRAVLKRQEGNSGYGLMRIEQAGDGYRLRFRERTTADEHFATRPDLERRLERATAGSTYLLQQWIDLPAYRERLSDYRVMMQKDDRGLWGARGIIGRFGEARSIVTNFVNRGYGLPADEAIRRAFGCGHREAFGLKLDLIDFARAVCEALDRTGGCYGDLGLDIGIDRKRRFWLFEVNKLPFAEMPLYMGDEQMYLDVKSGPLLFASCLSGFGRERLEGEPCALPWKRF